MKTTIEGKIEVTPLACGSTLIQGSMCDTVKINGYDIYVATHALPGGKPVYGAWVGQRDDISGFEGWFATPYRALVNTQGPLYAPIRFVLELGDQPLTRTTYTRLDMDPETSIEACIACWDSELDEEYVSKFISKSDFGRPRLGWRPLSIRTHVTEDSSAITFWYGCGKLSNQPGMTLSKEESDAAAKIIRHPEADSAHR